MELVTDRSQNHVDRLKKLRTIGWNNMTEDQKAEYTGYAAKGAYNYTDLNRVESNVQELSGIFELGLKTKTDWTFWDVPTASDMERYLNNVRAIRNACSVEAALALELPNTMDGLTYEGANNIEKVLQLVWDAISIPFDVR